MGKKGGLHCLFKPECIGWSYQSDEQPTAFDEILSKVLHFGHDGVWFSALKSLKDNNFLHEGKRQE